MRDKNDNATNQAAIQTDKSTINDENNTKRKQQT